VLRLLKMIQLICLNEDLISFLECFIEFLGLDLSPGEVPLVVRPSLGVAAVASLGKIDDR